MHPALRAVEHRPWPFARGSVGDATDVARPALCALADFSGGDGGTRACELALDTWEGACWIGVVPFWMSGVRLRGCPPIPGASQFPELNVRTYVTYGGKAGVYFFSLDAASRAAVWGARKFYHLPYFRARMQTESRSEEVSYHSLRLESGGEFRGTYRPVAAVKHRPTGTLEHWLTERYCLYTVHAGRVYRGNIHHEPWPLQDAAAEISMNSVATAAGVTLPQATPVLHFARRLDVLIWGLRVA
jgi:uncharacterized protein